jgi:hypothetical protein
VAESLAGAAEDEAADGVGCVVLGAADGVEDAEADADGVEPLLGDPGELVEGVADGSAAIPPCTVTRTAPGWNEIRAVHCPFGAAEVAVAMTARLCPGASVPLC